MTKKSKHQVLFWGSYLALNRSSSVSGHFWTLLDTSNLPRSSRNKKLRMLPQRIEIFNKNTFIWKKSFGICSVVAENEQKTCESPESSALRDHPGKSYFDSPARVRAGARLGAALIRDSRTFFARSPRLPNRFQNFFFHMKAFLLKIPNLLEGIRSFLFMELLGRVEVSISVNKCQ